MKKALLIILSVILMIGACGCGMRGQARIDRMISYINEKYNDDSFEYVSLSGGHLGSNTTKIIVKSEKYPDKEIRVICTVNNSVESFSDNYLNVKFEKETICYIKDALTAEYGEDVYVSYKPDDTACTEGASGETTFEEYISSETTYVYFTAVVNAAAENEDEALARVKELFSGGVVRAHIYFAKTEGSVADRGEEIIESKEYSKKLFIVKKNVDEYSEAEWTDGV